MWRERIVLLVLLLLGGCSSSTPSAGASSGSNTGASGASMASGSTAGTSCPASSPVTWRENGEAHCGTFAEAIIGTTSFENPVDAGRITATTVEITVLQSTLTDEFGFSVTSDSGLTGSYTCVASPSSNVLWVDDDIGVYATTQGTCSVTVDETSSADGGIVVSGTFSAALPMTDGGVRTITDGVFDLTANTEK